MSYLVVGIAIVVMLILKCYLMKHNFQKNTERFVNPKSFADQLLEAQIKKLGAAKVKEELSPANLMTIIRDNIAYLKSNSPSSNQKMHVQKLRNVCLCVQLLQNPSLTKENNHKQQIQRLNRELLEDWDSWLSAHKNSPGLAGEMSKYVLYLSKHFA